MAAAGGSQPIIPPSWTIPAWFIDPANSSACAVDTNSGTAATCSGGCSGATCPSGVGPIKTYAELGQHRWGTYSPRLRQASTTLTFLSGQPDSSDPIYASPYLEQGASLFVACTLPTPVLTTTLNVVTAKARATNQALATTFTSGVGLVAGQLVQNTTHPSFAWLYHNAAGTWTISQPLAPFNPPFLTVITQPAEVDTWAHLDAVSVYQLSTVNIITLTPTFSLYSGASTNGAFVQHCNINAPGAGDSAPWTIGQQTALAETSSGRTVNVPFATSVNYFNQSVNAFATLSYNLPANASGDIGAFLVFGGVIDGFGASTPVNGGSGMIVDADTVFGGASASRHTFGGLLALAYVDTNVVISPSFAGLNVSSQFYGGPTVYGPGSVGPLGVGRIQYPSGATSGATTFKVAGGLSLNGQTKGCIAQPGAATIGACNTATATGANLDTANGATTGCLVALGGGSFCNYGP